MSINQTLKWICPSGMAVAILCEAMLGFGVGVKADQHDKKTIVTFNAPVEIPGKALPVGTYVFKLLDSMGNRNIVQVFDR